MMADYIKRSDVLGIVSARLKPCNALIGDLCNACEDVYRMVELIPSADVQPVVRCKDCEYYRENKHGYCSFFDEKFMPFDGYCSNGVRMDGISNAQVMPSKDGGT